MLKRTAKPENAQPAAKRKLTRAERKQIEAIIRQAKGDGKPHTVQDSIPFRNLYPDGLCRLDDRLFSKTIVYEDVNYRLAGPDDQRDIFERLCDFYNGYDPSIGVQMTLSSRHEDKNGNLFGMDAQGDALDDMRVEASGILQIQYERGNNGFVKRKYVTLTIEAENLPAARARFSRIEADTLNRFKVMGAAQECWTARSGWRCCMAFSIRRADNSPLNGTGSRQAACPSRTLSRLLPSSLARRGVSA